VGNYLKVEKRQQVIALLALGWSYRRIERETGVRRETVAGYDLRRHPKPAKVFPGSEPALGPPELDFPGSSPSKPAKVFPGSPSKAAKVFPGSPSKPAKVFPGSAERSRSAAAVHHDVIVAKLEQRLNRPGFAGDSIN